MVFLVFALYFQHALSNQPNLVLSPCHFMYKGRTLYTDQYPNTPIPEHITSHPLSLDDDLPIELYLNNSIPGKYRDVFHNAALKWNTKAELEIIRISDEIDHSEVRNQEDSRNVIYWRDNSQYNVESITSSDGSIKTATETFIEVNHVVSPDYYIPITDVDIIIYEEENTVRGHTHWIFTSLLEAAGISEDMDVLDLQSLAIHYQI